MSLRLISSRTIKSQGIYLFTNHALGKLLETSRNTHVIKGLMSLGSPQDNSRLLSWGDSKVPNLGLSEKRMLAIVRDGDND